MNAAGQDRRYSGYTISLPFSNANHKFFVEFWFICRSPRAKS